MYIYVGIYIYTYILNVLDEDVSAIFDGTLVKWGTSLGLVIPKPIREGMNLKAGDKVRLSLQGKKICMKKLGD